jgi:hypothetical protein
MEVDPSFYVGKQNPNVERQEESANEMSPFQNLQNFGADWLT